MNLRSPTAVNLANANLGWSHDEERIYDVPSSALRAPVDEAIASLVPEGERPEAEKADGADTWNVPLRVETSLFGDCQLTARVIPEGDSTTKVTVSIRFEATPNALGLYLWISMTLIGIPVALLWRARSIRTARKRAHRELEAFWRLLPAKQSAYR